MRLSSNNQAHHGELEVQRLPLLPGANPVLDMLCERIIDGQDLILSPALIEAAPATIAGATKPAPPSVRVEYHCKRLQLDAFEKYEAKDWAGALDLFNQALALRAGLGRTFI